MNDDLDTLVGYITPLNTIEGIVGVGKGSGENKSIYHVAVVGYSTNFDSYGNYVENYTYIGG